MRGWVQVPQLMAHGMRHDLFQRLLQVFAQCAAHADQGILQGRLQHVGDALFQQVVDLALHLMQDALRQALLDGVPVRLRGGRQGGRGGAYFAVSDYALAR